MMYLGYTTEILLPNWNLGLYTVNSFTFDLQDREAAPRKSAFARLSHASQPRYRGADPILEGPVYTGYAG